MQQIKQLLGQKIDHETLDPNHCLTWVQQVNAAYVSFLRHEHEAQEVVDLKLCVIFWRSRLVNHLLLHQTPPWLESQQDLTIQILVAINTRLSATHQQIMSKILSPFSVATIMASQGSSTSAYPELDVESGPGVLLNIVANRGSSTPYEKWRENELFTRYQYEGEGVRFRGTLFMPGDMLLANVNVDGNGVYTSLSEPRSFCSHAAVFAMLEHKGKKIPVVIETYEKGVRPVPLSIFLGHEFCSYLEVYRHTDYRPEHAHNINLAAADFIDSVLAYNFNSEDKDKKYMSCTAVGRFMHQAASLSPATRISHLTDPMVQKNLGKMGYQHFDYFGPVDFLMSECLQVVGVIDNNHLEHLLAREMIDREFRRLFTTLEVEPSRYPWQFKMNLWGIEQMRKQSLIGKLISKIEGFDATTLPKGPNQLLALILLAEKQVGISIHKTRESVITVLEELDFLDMDQFVNDHRIKTAVRQNLKLPWLQAETTGSA